MVRAAEQLQYWRASGKLPDDAHGLIASGELANYCAWFAPREKVFMNTRYNFHRPEMPDYIGIRRELGLVPADEIPDAKKLAEELGEITGSNTSRSTADPAMASCGSRPCSGRASCGSMYTMVALVSQRAKHDRRLARPTRPRTADLRSTSIGPNRPGVRQECGATPAGRGEANSARDGLGRGIHSRSRSSSGRCR